MNIKHTKPQVIVLLQKIPNGYVPCETRNTINIPREIFPAETTSSNRRSQKIQLTPQTKNRPSIVQQAPQPFEVPVKSDKPQETGKDWFLQNWDQIIPASARWFKIEYIHQIEKEALPEFFHTHFHHDYQTYFQGNYKTPAQYLKRRNQIINRWISSQGKYLKFTDCLNFIGGDASSLLRVYSFLEHWGLINFQYSPNNLPNQGYVYQINENFIERVKVNFQHNTSFNFHTHATVLCDICSQNMQNMYKQKTSTLASFQLQTLVICTKCLVDNVFPQFLKKDDFQLMNSDIKQASWTQDELLKLLELVYKYKEKWNEIAKHFSKRSLTEIVRTYLQLPYSDMFSYQGSESNFCKITNKDQITCQNDTSNPIQMGASCFKYQLDTLNRQQEKLKDQEKMELPDKQPCLIEQLNGQKNSTDIDSMTKQLIENQLESIQLKVDYLSQYDELVSVDKANLVMQQKQNLQLIVQIQSNLSDDLYL